MLNETYLCSLTVYHLSLIEQVLHHCCSQPVNDVMPGTALFPFVDTTRSTKEPILPKVGVHETGTWRIKCEELYNIWELLVSSTFTIVLGAYRAKGIWRTWTLRRRNCAQREIEKQVSVRSGYSQTWAAMPLWQLQSRAAKPNDFPPHRSLVNFESNA